MTISFIGTTVDILGKSYQIKCPADQIGALHKAAQYLEEKMQEVRTTTNTVSHDRLAVIAALNFAYLLLTVEHQKISDAQTMEIRLRELSHQIDSALSYP
jgi:cell division protein ZapA